MDPSHLEEVGEKPPTCKWISTKLILSWTWVELIRLYALRKRSKSKAYYHPHNAGTLLQATIVVCQH